ncbi:hypothetical protein GW17_00059795, partial [Ensete ventricosum]
AGEGNPGSVIILQKHLGVGTATVASSVGRGWPVCASSPAVSVRSWSSGIGRNLGVQLGKSTAWVVERGLEGGSTGAEAYIVGVVDHPYLVTWLPLWLTMLSHTSTMPVVLAVGHVSTGKGAGCVRPAVRPLAPPHLRPTSFPHRVDHVGGPTPSAGYHGVEDLLQWEKRPTAVEPSTCYGISEDPPRRERPTMVGAKAHYDGALSPLR